MSKCTPLVEREENKCAPKQRVRAIEDKPAEPDNNEAENVARVFSDRGRGRGGGRGGRGGRGGNRQNYRSGSETKRTPDENQAQKKNSRETPCPYCLAWLETERFDHRPGKCFNKTKIKALKEKNSKSKTEPENVKTVEERRVSGFDRYDHFENGQLGFSYE